MKHILLAGVLVATVLVSACGAGGSPTGVPTASGGSPTGAPSGSGGGAVDQSMIDAIKGYTQVIYENDQDNWPKYMCQADVDAYKKRVEKPGSTGPVATFTYDLSDIKWSIKQRSAAGDVVLLNIDSGKLKATDKNGKVIDNMPIPGSAGGVKLKNENGWKVCSTASL